MTPIPQKALQALSKIRLDQYREPTWNLNSDEHGLHLKIFWPEKSSSTSQNNLNPSTTNDINANFYSALEKLINLNKPSNNQVSLNSVISSNSNTNQYGAQSNQMAMKPAKTIFTPPHPVANFNHQNTFSNPQKFVTQPKNLQSVLKNNKPNSPLVNNLDDYHNILKFKRIKSVSNSDQQLCNLQPDKFQSNSGRRRVTFKTGEYENIDRFLQIMQKVSIGRSSTTNLNKMSKVTRRPKSSDKEIQKKTLASNFINVSNVAQNISIQNCVQNNSDLVNNPIPKSRKRKSSLQIPNSGQINQHSTTCLLSVPEKQICDNLNLLYDQNTKTSAKFENLCNSDGTSPKSE